MQYASWLRILGLSGCILCLNAQAACTTPVLVSPVTTEISEASPRFEWKPVNDVHHYLVWLESRVPEGRVLVAEEFQTSATYFVPPRPLTTGKATLRIRVTAVCNDNTQATLSTRFRIDEDSACRLRVAPVAEQDNGQWKMRWEALQTAQRYEIRVHAADDGKPVLTRASNGTTATVGRFEPGIWLFAVQPVCRGLKGVNSWVAVETH
jgi:hypothetical protein